MRSIPNSRPSSLRERRSVESVVLAKLVERGPGGLGEAQVIEEMTTVVNTPERVMSVRSAIEGLLEVDLLIKADEILRPTPAAVRAGELEMGL